MSSHEEESVWAVSDTDEGRATLVGCMNGIGSILQSQAVMVRKAAANIIQHADIIAKYYGTVCVTDEGPEAARMVQRLTVAMSELPLAYANIMSAIGQTQGASQVQQALATLLLRLGEPLPERVKDYLQNDDDGQISH